MGLLAAVSTPDALVFGVVVAARFVLPLFIPRFPLPALLACLVLDAADQSIFQMWTSLDLTGYQSYDKALDVYYLTLTYLAVIRNWGSPALFAVGAFLWYYRLVGVTLFELTDTRALLLVFPNTFEYYVIAIEAVRTGWRTDRLPPRAPVLIAAAIWVFVKLPQEYWIHVAQLDTTDLVKERLFGVEATASWSTAVSNRPWALVLLLAVAAALGLALWAIARRLPARDWPLTLGSDTVNERLGWMPPPGRWALPAWHGRRVAEKVVLAGLVNLIFFKLFPGSSASNVRVFLIVGAGVVVTGLAGLALAHRFGWRGSLVAGPSLLTWSSNLVVSTVALWLLANLVSGSFGVRVRDVAFFAVLTTIIVTLFDHYRARRDACTTGLPAPAAPILVRPAPPGRPGGIIDAV